MSSSRAVFPPDLPLRSRPVGIPSRWFPVSDARGERIEDSFVVHLISNYAPEPFERVALRDFFTVGGSTRMVTCFD